MMQYQFLPGENEEKEAALYAKQDTIEAVMPEVYVHGKRKRGESYKRQWSFTDPKGNPQHSATRKRMIVREKKQGKLERTMVRSEPAE